MRDNPNDGNDEVTDLIEPEPIRFLESESRNRRTEPHGRRPQSRRPERSRRAKILAFQLEVLNNHLKLLEPSYPLD